MTRDGELRRPPGRDYVASTLVLRERSFAWGKRTYLMGIINVTPDSFSGDGLAMHAAAAALLAQRFESEGADIIDVGAESSRPGADPLPAEVELERLLPALEAVRAATKLPVSVDTYHAAVAEQALAAGADAINDISGLHGDSAMAPLLAKSGAALIAMHNQRGKPFHDVVGDVLAGFESTLAIAAAAGIDTGKVILDPGFGFGWTPEQNLEMLRRLPELGAPGLPLLVGTSRKSTIGFVLDRPVHERTMGTAATVALAIAGGADIVRVHDVAEMRDVVRVSDAVVRDNWRYAG